MPFSSHDAFQSFAAEITLQRRYIRSPASERFLESLLALADQRLEIVPRRKHYYRARLGHGGHGPLVALEWPPLIPYPKEEMFPPIGKAIEGRIYPVGIPVLYLATEVETALMEVRPWIDSYVSLGEFEVRRDLRLVDFSRSGPFDGVFLEGTSDPGKIPDIIWNQIDLAFSQPSTREDGIASYAVTQTIAELFRHNGYDGLIYKSHFGPEGKNVALFSFADAVCFRTYLLQIESMSCKWRRSDSAIGNLLTQDEQQARS